MHPRIAMNAAQEKIVSLFKTVVGFIACYLIVWLLSVTFTDVPSWCQKVDDACMCIHFLYHMDNRYYKSNMKVIWSVLEDCMCYMQIFLHVVFIRSRRKTRDLGLGYRKVIKMVTLWVERYLTVFIEDLNIYRHWNPLESWTKLPFTNGCVSRCPVSWKMLQMFRYLTWCIFLLL